MSPRADSGPAEDRGRSGSGSGSGAGGLRRGARRREETAAVLRERLSAADAEIQVPPGLWDRVRGSADEPGSAPATGSTRATGVPPRQRDGSEARGAPSAPAAPGPQSAPAPVPVRLRRPGPFVVTVVAACAVVFVAVGAWWLLPFGSPATKAPPATGGTPSGTASSEVNLSVYNAESACRKLRTLECALRLAKDPRDEYAAPDNSAGRVWHGDELTAVCVLTRGRLVKDESGISSTRWYLTRKQDGTEGWLPGVRTRNSSEVQTCSAAQAKRPARAAK